MQAGRGSTKVKQASVKKKGKASERQKQNEGFKGDTKTRVRDVSASPAARVRNGAIKSPSPAKAIRALATLSPQTTRSPRRPNKRPAEDAIVSTRDSSVFDELRQKFDQLSMLRTTAAEQLLEEYKKSAEQRIQAAERLIESLRQENNDLRTRTAQAALSPSPPPLPRLSDVSSLSTQEEPLRTARSVGGSALGPIIELYQSLTGLAISATEDSDNLWRCTIAGRQGGLAPRVSLTRPEFAFDLSLDTQVAQYCYQPTFSPHAEITTRLPAYLQEPIVFDCSQLQLFFWRALNFLMSSSPVAAAAKS